MGWLIPNEKLLNGVSICNSLDIPAFETILNFAFVNSNGTAEEKQSAIEDLQGDSSITSLEKPHLNLAIKTLAYLLKRSLNFIFKPETLVEDLESVAKLDKEKADSFAKFWVAKTKGVLEGVNSGRELTDIEWDLKVELSSSAQQRMREPVGVVRLRTADEEKLQLEMNHSELLQFYSKLEEIQDELDFLKNR